jgi:hypothetical protein
MLQKLSLLETAKRCLDVGVSCELTALSLSKSFRHSWELRRVDLFGLFLAATEAQHRGHLSLLSGGHRRTVSRASSRRLVMAKE